MILISNFSYFFLLANDEEQEEKSEDDDFDNYDEVVDSTTVAPDPVAPPAAAPAPDPPRRQPRQHPSVDSIQSPIQLPNTSTDLVSPYSTLYSTSIDGDIVEMANTVIQYCFHEGERQDQIDLAFDQRISQPREHLRVEVLMPGGTTYFKDIKYIVIEGGTKLRLLIKAQPQWFMSNRVSDDVDAATVRAGAGGNLNSTRLRSHRKAITDITDACAGDPKFIFTIKLKKKCELRLTDRDDMGYATGVTAEVVYYKHGNPYFQPYQAL